MESVGRRCKHSLKALGPIPHERGQGGAAVCSSCRPVRFQARGSSMLTMNQGRKAAASLQAFSTAKYARRTRSLLLALRSHLTSVLKSKHLFDKALDAGYCRAPFAYACAPCARKTSRSRGVILLHIHQRGSSDGHQRSRARSRAWACQPPTA